jgi:hypothetical protein
MHLRFPVQGSRFKGSRKDFNPSIRTVNGEPLSLYRSNPSTLNGERGTFELILGHWTLKFGISLEFGACILLFDIISGGRASPEI